VTSEGVAWTFIMAAAGVGLGLGGFGTALVAMAFLRYFLGRPFQHGYLPIDDLQHLEEVGSEPIASAEQEHVES
jgi:hypothetical protein